MTIGIAHDLWPDIIRLVSLDALCDLSRVSPLFDEVIFQAGIRVFYKNNIVHDLSPVGRFKVLQFASGKKRVIDTRKVVEMHINIYNKFYDFGPRVYYDDEARIGMLIRNGCIHIFKNFRNHDYYHVARIEECIYEDVYYIDFTTKVAVAIGNGYETYSFESFEILFEDGFFWGGSMHD